jgi:iron complex outermembrane receptor protein
MNLVYRPADFSRQALHFPATNRRVSQIAKCAVLLMSTALASVAGAAPTVALDNHARVFNIPAQNLDGALAAFANQAELQMVAPSNLVGGLKTTGISGKLTPSDALNALLLPAGLTYSMTEAHTIAVTRLAQSQPPTAAPSGPTASGAAAVPSGLEELVVTARRREEKLQSVPLSVTAFSAATLERQHIENATDLQRIVPSFSSYNTQRDRQFLQIRGQYNATGGPAVVAYFNEVPGLSPLTNSGFSAAGGGGPGLFYDLDSVQVLKGPQGTLFGQNTTGGAILLYPKKPTEDYSGYAQLTVGEYSDLEFEGAVNIPIVADKLLVRVSGRRAERDGFTTDIQTGKDLDNRDYWAARVSVIFRPADDFENYLVLNSIYNHSSGTSFVLSAVKSAATGGVLASVWDRLLGAGYVENQLVRQQAVGPRKLVGEFGEGLGAFSEGLGPLEKYWNYSLNDIATWNIDEDITLKNIFGYQVLKQIEHQSAAPVPGFDFILPAGWNTNEEEYTEELQVQGKARSERLIWQAGAFGSFTHPIGQQVFLNQTLTNKILATVNPISLSRALYAQATYDLGDIDGSLDGLKLTAGYRYTWDSKSNGATAVLPAAQRCQLALAVYPSCSLGGNARFQAASWTVGLDYQLDPQTLIYVVGRRGYISGGINNFAPIPGTQSYSPEYLVDAEIGIKADWELLGAKVRTNLDAYRGYFKSIQSSNSIVVPGTATVVTVAQNTGKATISGVEFESTIVPFADLEINGSYAYTYAHFNEYNVVGCGCIVDPVFPATPLQKFSLTGTYHVPFIAAEIGNVSVGATWSYQTHQAVANLASHQLGVLEPAYGLLNVRADWKGIMGTAADLSFFMTNALDKTYRAGTFPLYEQLGFASDIYGEPRMWGFQLRYQW